MRRALRIAAYVVGSLAALVVVAAIAVFVISELKIRRTYDIPLRSISARTDSASLAEGERLARIRGCFGGCHGKALEGRVFFDEPGVATIWAPNLTMIVRDHSDPELERVIRHGVRRNGRSVFAMPSEMFAGLADDDLASIIGFLRSQPVVENNHSGFSVGPVGRFGLMAGMFKPVAPGIQAARTPERVPREVEIDWGHYLVQTTCTECHGTDLRGDPSGKPPNLRIAAAFSEADWLRLMRQGRGLGDRDVGLMGRVALSRFRYLTDAELHAIRAYLQKYASTESAQD